MSPATLEISKENVGDVIVLTIAGPIDSATIETFKKELHDACSEKGAKVVLDCLDLTYMNSKSFGLLSAYHRTSLVDMGGLALCNLNRRIVKTMDLLGLGQMLKICETREEAVSALSG